MAVAGFRAVSKLKRFGNKLVIEDKQEKKVVDNVRYPGWEDWVRA